MADLYCRDVAYRTSVNEQVRQLAKHLLGGRIGVIAASRSLRVFQHVVEGAWPELSAALLVFVAIDSETDALPIGTVREMWHPSTAELEDQKVTAAEERWHEKADQACHRILKLLGSETVGDLNE